MTADEASRTEALLAFPSEEGEGRTPPSPISDSTETIDPEGSTRILDVTEYQFNRQSDRPQQLRILVVESYVPSVALETALTGHGEPDPVIDHGHDSRDVEVVMPMDSTGVGRFDLPLKYGSLEEAIAQHASVPSQRMRSMFAGLVGIYSRVRRFTGTQLHGASATFCRMHQQTARAMCRSAFVVTRAVSSAIASGKDLGRSIRAAFHDRAATLGRDCRLLRVAMRATSDRMMIRIGRYGFRTIHAFVGVANDAVPAARRRILLISHESSKAVTAVTRSACHAWRVGGLSLVKRLQLAAEVLNRSLSLQFADGHHVRTTLATFACGVVLGAGVSLLIQQVPSVMRLAFSDSDVSPASAFDQTPSQAGQIREATLPIAPPSAGQAPPASPRSMPGAPFRGSLAVRSSPAGAQVFLNGVLVGATPLILRNLPVGSRAMRLDLNGHLRWSAAVRIVANERTSVAARLQPSSSGE